MQFPLRSLTLRIPHFVKDVNTELTHKTPHLGFIRRVPARDTPLFRMVRMRNNGDKHCSTRPRNNKSLSNAIRAFDVDSATKHAV